MVVAPVPSAGWEEARLPGISCLYRRSSMCSEGNWQWAWLLHSIDIGSHCPLGFSSPAISWAVLACRSPTFSLIISSCRNSVATSKFSMFLPKLPLPVSLSAVSLRREQFSLAPVSRVSWLAVRCPSIFLYKSLLHPFLFLLFLLTPVLIGSAPRCWLTSPPDTTVLLTFLPQSSQCPRFSSCYVWSPEPSSPPLIPSTPLTQILCQGPSSQMLFLPLNSVPITSCIIPRSFFVTPDLNLSIQGNHFCLQHINTTLDTMWATSKNGVGGLSLS